MSEIIIKKPEIVVFAGPNGSGKTTITKMAKIVGQYINADEIKQSINCSNLEAANKAEELRRTFFVPVDEIRANDYDLTINKYREIEREKKVYRKTTDIISDIEQLNDEKNALLVELKNMLGSDGDE